MKKSLKILIVLLAVSSLLLPLFAETVYAAPVCDPATEKATFLPNGQVVCDKINPTQGGPNSRVGNEVTGGLPDWANPANWLAIILNGIGGLLLRIGSLILALVGLLFDVVLKYTIVDMADQINNKGGLGGGINEAWATLRDVANIAFIFVLLWAAFQTILQLDTGKFGTAIRNIIIVALLINFSLFFSKVVIDASNIATVGFYNSIIDGAKSSSITLPFPLGDVKGFSSIFMKAVGVQSFWSASFLGTGLTQGFSQNMNEFITGLLGVITMLIMAMILLVMTVMFLARYIILIFLMILSPLAAIGYMIPGLNSKFKEWWSALVNQSFFAPYFMLLTWVAIKLIVALGPNFQSNKEFATVATFPKDSLALFMNFALVIGFMVMALILSKKMATSTAGFAAVAGGIGAVSVGAVGFAGRQTIGRWSKGAANDTDLKKRAAEGDVGARMKLGVANRFSKSSFDARGIAETKLGKAAGGKELLGGIGGTFGKGGFAGAVDEKAKKKAQYAKDVYGQTATEKEEEAKRKKAYEDGDNKKNAEKAVENEKKVVTEKERETSEMKKKAEEDFNKKKKEADDAREARIAGLMSFGDEEKIKKAAADAEEKLTKAKEDHIVAITNKKKVIDDKDYSDATKVLQELADADKKAWEEVREAGKERQLDYAKRVERGLPGTRWMGRFQPNQGAKASAMKIREQVKGKSNKEKAADLLKDIEKEEKAAKGEKEEEKEETKPEDKPIT